MAPVSDAAGKSWDSNAATHLIKPAKDEMTMKKERDSDRTVLGQPQPQV
jgi:hypothetical protein